ncbi:unnamed protein product [Closterium sp. NIES-54]
MMEKFFSFMSFYEQHQQGAPAQSNNSNNNNNVTPMSLDGSSYARGNQQQQPTFAPYEPQRGSVSFMPQPQPAPGQERTLDALQVQSQFAHVLKLQTTNSFDGKDFFTWSFEFELMMEGAQILGFFDGSLPYPTNGTQYEKQQYTYQSMMAYTILLRNITPTQQQNIRSYRGYGNSAELTYNHLKSLYQATDSVSQSRLMAQLTTVEMKLGEKGMAYISRCRELRDKLLRCGGSISEDAFVTVIIGGLGPQWRATKAILRAHGRISEAALCAEIHAEQQDMDLQEERHKKKSVSQLMAKSIHLEADSTTQEFKLYHGKGGLYIGKAILKNNVFVLDFVPDLGTADSDGIVTFTSWMHPPDLDPDFSPEGFWYSHTIPEEERTRALVTIQHSAAAETTSAAAETTSAAAETSSAVAGTTTVAATTTPVLVDDAPPTPAQQLKPAQREVHRSANFTAAFYSNSNLYRHLPHRPFTSHHNPSAPVYAPLDKVYSDILYNREPGQGAYSYTITFIDAATRYVWHLNLPSKDMAFEAFIAWLPVAERESGEKLKSFQSDGGGEYTSQQFKQFLAEKGIKRLISLPYAHQQQGVAERMNRTLHNTMRKLLRGMRLPNHQWPEAMDHAVMLHNLLTSSSLPNNASPHLLWTGKQGSTKMLRVFGCMVQYRPPSARAGRFSQRAQWGLHLGIEKNYNAWKIFDIQSKETVAARDVIFYERLTLPTYLANLEENRDPTGGFRGDQHFTSAADKTDWDEQNVDNASDEAGPLPYCSVPIPMDDENPRDSVNAETYFDLADTGYVTPAEVNTNEAERVGPNFIPDPEDGDEAAYPEDTTLPRYTQSGLQILGLVTAVHGMDTPKEPAMVQQALGGEHKEKWREAMDKELKALQERNTWKVVPIDVARNKTILIGKWVFRVKTKADGTIDKPRDYGSSSYTLGLPASDSSNCRTTKAWELQQDLTLTVSSTVTQYLGLNIREEKDAIYLSAEKYADTMAKRFTLTPSAITTPYRYATGNHKEGSSLLKFVGIRVYQRKLGCLLFAAVTCRPDLSYSASQLATYLKKPEAEHLAELDRALHYFVSTSTIGLTYYKNTTTPTKLIGFVDADHAGDSDNRRSRTGYIYRLEPIGPISWQSSKQELIALSSAEAEYIALCSATKEGLYLRELLEEAKLAELPNFTLFCDNQSAIRIANKSGFANRTKHIALRYFFVKDEIEKGRLELSYCPTSEMAADYLTKKLGKSKFEYCMLLT